MTNRNKYGAVKTHSELCNRTFDSKAEAKRGEQLLLMQQDGKISELEYQVKRILSGETHYKASVTIDFSYRINGERIYEDVKGFKTRDAQVKFAWLNQLYGIKVKIFKG